MNRGPLSVVVRAGVALFGVMWLWAAASKAAGPEDAYEFTARLVGGGDPAKAVLVLWAALEAGLGAAMLFGAMRPLRACIATAAGLAGATAALLVVKHQWGGSVRCGCMALLADGSVDAGITRNIWFLAAVVVLGGLAFVSDRRDRGAPADSGPGTPTP